MGPSLGRHIAALLLFPMLLLFSGVQVGAWHCASGKRCEVATVLTCCCGCAESGAGLAHSCEPVGASLSAGPCGCYYEAQALDAQRAKEQWVKHLALVPPVPRLFAAPGSLIPLLPTPAVTGSPPSYLISPTGSRAPPLG